MNLRKLKKEFGKGFEVSRDRKLREVRVAAGGLGYTVEEKAFGTERELADYLRSKTPIMTVGKG